VTRLGEYTPVGRLFSLGSFMKNTVAALKFGLLISNEKKIAFKFDTQ
jgi:hypothetical protein